MLRIPTDRQILQAIYDRHADSLENFDRGMADRDSKIMVPIDCAEIGRELKVHPDIVFGRLYFHLEQKHGYYRQDRRHVALFTREAGKDKDCVNLPFLASVLAGLQEERARHVWALGLSIASIVLSIVALVASVLKP